MSLNTRAAAALLALWCACAPAEPAPELGAPAPESLAPPSSGHRAAPFRAELFGPPQPVPGEPLALRIRLRRAPGFVARAQISVSPPSGLAFSPQRSTRPLVTSAGPELRELVYSFDLERVPAQDLVVDVDVSAAGAGYHAALRYRFGRAAPAPRRLDARGRRVRVGGRDFGPSITVLPGASDG